MTSRIPEVTLHKHSKRQSGKKSGHKVTKRRRPARRQSLPYSSDQFRLMDLPAELRAHVYEKVLEGMPQAYLTTRTRSNLASRSALPRVTRQIRDEFLPVMYFCAPEIMARVKDFDFRHLVTFLNRLSEAEMKTLPSTSTPTSRTITIKLTFTEKMLERYCYTIPNDELLLRRWLNRLEDLTKKGAKIDVRYCVDPEIMWRVLQNLAREFAYRLTKCRDGIRKMETQKMLNAFKDENGRRQQLQSDREST